MTRHTFAVNYLARGGRIEVLQKVLGHSSITTTQIYAEILDKYKKKGLMNTVDFSEGVDHRLTENQPKYQYGNKKAP